MGVKTAQDASIFDSVIERHMQLTVTPTHGDISSRLKTYRQRSRDRETGRVIAVGQWLVSGLQWSSSARQSLAARQKVLSE